MIPITIELDEQDLQHFRRMFQQAQATRSRLADDDVLARSGAMIDEASKADPPRYMRTRLDGLRELRKMAIDAGWQMPEEDRRRVVSALAYFIDPSDLIEDRIAGLGFLDDAIAVELILQELKHEIESYREFCSYREAEVQRRINQGLPAEVDKDDWLADKRSTLHMRMRDRRVSDPAGWGYTLY